MSDRDHMDRRMADHLDRFLTEQIEQDTRAVPVQPAAPRTRPTVWVTAAVGVMVLLLAVVAIRTAEDRRDATLPATSPTISATPSAVASSSAEPTPSAGPVVLGTAALLKKLPKPDYGRLLHTWTEANISTTGPFDAGGDVVVIAGICNGGGAVNLTDVDGKVHTLSCNGLRIQQPFSKFNLGGDEQPTKTTKPFQIDVTVLKGTPTFVIRMWAVDPRIVRSGWFIAETSKEVPATLRTCAAGDLAATGTLQRLSTQHGAVVTITNTSSSDCAVRSWPAMRYLDKAGRQLGGKATQSLDSSEGALNRFHEFPPARLRAGGHGYFIVELQTQQRLEDDDRGTRKENAKQAATPSPSPNPIGPLPICDPVPVASLQLTVAGTRIRVPVSGDPVIAACRSSSFAFGVDPVVDFRPTGK